MHRDGIAGAGLLGSVLNGKEGRGLRSGVAVFARDGDVIIGGRSQ